MVGRSDFFRHVSVYADSVVMSFRGVVESLAAVRASVGLFSGTMDEYDVQRSMCGRDQMKLYVLESFVRLQRPLTRETPLAESTYIVSGESETDL